MSAERPEHEQDLKAAIRPVRELVGQREVRRVHPARSNSSPAESRLRLRRASRARPAIAAARRLPCRPGRLHRRIARDLARHGHPGAAKRHRQAADAHEAAVAAPLDEKAARTAMRAAAQAYEANQRVGVRPLMPWPGGGGG